MKFIELKQNLQKDGYNELASYMEAAVLADVFMKQDIYMCAFVSILQECGLLNEKLEYKIRN